MSGAHCKTLRAIQFSLIISVALNKVGESTNIFMTGCKTEEYFAEVYYCLLHSKAKKLGESYIRGWLKTHIFWAIAFLNYEKSSYYFTRRKFTELCFCFCHNQVIIMGETHSALHQEIKIFWQSRFLIWFYPWKLKQSSWDLNIAAKSKSFFAFFYYEITTKWDICVFI